MTIEIDKPLALFDMDGTLCDYDGAMRKDLKMLADPYDQIDYDNADLHHLEAYPWLDRRMQLIKASGKWWRTLPKLQLGFDIYSLTKSLGFQHMILTQGPKRNYQAWSNKLKWVHKNMPDQLDVTITRNKGLVYGKILVDDYPVYIQQWLTWRKRGTVIMPDHVHNQGFEHKQVVRYTGNNFDQVKEAIVAAKERSISPSES